MIGVERIARALVVVGASQWVSNGSGALSVNLISPSGGGKSQLILNHLPIGARVETDVTFMTLSHLVRSKPRPTYLVIPDLNLAISHKPAVAELTMATLLALMGEGIAELNPGLKNEVSVKMTKAKMHGIRMAVITGMTPLMFSSKRGKWRSTGLLRRFVPLNYVYKRTTQNKIQEAIAAGQDTLAYNHISVVRHRRRAVEIPAGIDHHIRDLSEQVLDQMQWSHKSDAGRSSKIRALEYPFDPHKNLRQLARAAAVLNERATVTVEDMADVENIAAFMRLDRPEEL